MPHGIDGNKKGEEGPPAWMLTFADLISLMLTFFVLLFSMSELRKEKFDDTVSALASHFIPSEVRRDETSLDNELTVTKITVPKGLPLDYLKALIKSNVEKRPELEGVLMHDAIDRLLVTLPSDQLFRPGSATLTRDALQTIRTLAEILRYVKNRIEVDGHADPSALDNSRFKDNWELSLARATSVAETLMASGLQRKVTVWGYGDSRFYDLDPNLPLAKREQLGRRVDIVIREAERRGG